MIDKYHFVRRGAATAICGRSIAHIENVQPGRIIIKIGVWYSVNVNSRCQNCARSI